MPPSPDRAPTIAVIIERRHADKPAILELRSSLEAAGCRVPVVVPDTRQLHGIPAEMPPWDAVLSRGRNLAGLGLLAWASALGVLAVNSPRAIELVRNKIAMQSVLLEQGLPVPQTWFAADVAVFRTLPRERFPLVVKPFDGDGSTGLALLERPEDVDLLEPRTSRRTLYLAQEFLETDGSDLKLYGIGRDVWAVRKESPISFTGPGPAVPRPTSGAELVPLDRRLEEIALTCGRALGLELWGVDVALTPRGPVIIEVNDFPTYSAVPAAGAAIASHVLRLVELERLVRSCGRDRARSLVRLAA
jgi:ribosomal protein S6--L-glutamate ligase